MLPPSPLFSTKPPYPSLGARSLAFILDAFIVAFIQVVVRRGYFGESLSILPPLTALSLITIIYVLSGYWTVSSTYGKVVMGMRIVDKNGRKMGFVQSLKRITIMIPGLLLVGLGYFYAITNPERKSFHDKVAQTIVIFDES